MCLVGAAARLLSHTMDSVIGGMPSAHPFFAFFLFVPKLHPLTPSLSYISIILTSTQVFKFSVQQVYLQSLSMVWGETSETTETSGGLCQYFYSTVRLTFIPNSDTSIPEQDKENSMQH